ncbi:hypothetical protein [Sorangium sp. So ce341]|uniref:Nmad2 family putative nucleotide modification protein n=1 Tax=Sorangium sp. So ce341 TaxID=3133302 RepID=UPI003F5FC6D7
MPKVFIYVIDRDFGFAPNPFHGSCTLATCKPGIRKSAAPGDWVVGMGGSRLKATGRCIYAMRVGRKLSFNDYWNSTEFRSKRPVRNGSKKMMVGDNIYFQDPARHRWHQVDSHHSNADGSPNPHNIERDTRVDAVLISNHFYYFGSEAPVVPNWILRGLGYENGRSYRVFDLDAHGYKLVRWLEGKFSKCLNRVLADPFDFDDSVARYSVKTNRISVPPRSSSRR